MKITVYDAHKKLTPDITADMLLLVSVEILPAVIAMWTPNELALAYDWAAREHLAASDNRGVRRPKPWFVTAAELATSASRPEERSTTESTEPHR